MRPTLSIVIVNYNAGPYLARCLDSLEKQSFQDFEVIVIDNASKDASYLAAKNRPRIELVENRENKGFAAAQNQGFSRSSGRFLMPLNFDIYLMPEFLEKVVAVLDAHPTVGTVSGKMLRMLPDGRWTNEFDNAGLLLSPGRKPLHRGQGEKDLGQYQQQDFVFGAMGAAAVYRREMLNDIAFRGQYFDESYFTWWEDVDLDWRSRLRGWDCLYVPGALAYHVGDPQKNNATAFAARHAIRNRWQMILSNDCIHCISRDLRLMLIEELKLVRHVIKFHLVTAYLTALGEMAVRLPAVLAKRRWVRGRAKILCLPDYPISQIQPGGN
jgi:GT2 family glycosyltransferase